MAEDGLIADLSKDGFVLVDCSGNTDGLTVDTILRIIMSSFDGEIRLDDVIISPVVHRGRLTLHIEVSPRYRSGDIQPFCVTAAKS